MPESKLLTGRDAMAAALRDACDLLEGWVLTKCPKRFRQGHMLHIQGLRSTAEPQPLDGLPMVTGVLVVWHRVRDAMPDEGHTLNLFMPDLVDESIGETGVCEGYREPGSGVFMSTAGEPLPGVQWWAHQTAAPVEVRD